MNDYDSFIDVVYTLDGVTNNEIAAMSFYHDFTETLSDLTNLIESGYVNHQTSWTLNYFEFFVELTAVNKYTMDEIVNVYRADVLLLEYCGRPRPCLFEFAA